METVIAILELVGLVLVVVYLFTHKHGTRKSPAASDCGCGGGMHAAAPDLSFPIPNGACA